MRRRCSHQTPGSRRVRININIQRVLVPGLHSPGFGFGDRHLFAVLVGLELEQKASHVCVSSGFLLSRVAGGVGCSVVSCTVDVHVRVE